MRRLIAAVLVLAMMLAACGGGPSLTEYAEELESAVTAMNGELDRLDAELADTNDLEKIKRYASSRVAARYEFVRILENLDAPSNVSDLHDAALGIMRRLADAEAALAAYVDELDTLAVTDDVWATPLGVAAREVDADAVELCLAAEEHLDTSERSELADVPWIPPELKEVVVVAFGCIGDER